MAQVVSRFQRVFLRRLRRWFRWQHVLVACTSLFLWFLLLNWAFPLPETKAWSQVVLGQDGSLMTAYLTPDEKWRMRTSIDEVPDELVNALIEKEDQYFWHHPGVNPFALVRAAGANVLAGKRTSGASTITMQLARMMEPKPRTMGNKLIEMFRAFQLEWRYSKTEILELYLSYLPYGGNVEGVKAASYLYFDQPPQALSLGQSTLLTVIPNRPNSLRPDRHPEAARQARNKWLTRFEEASVFPKTDISTALAEPIVPNRHAIPNPAPQFARRLAGEPGTHFLPTTLHPEVQAHSQALLLRHVKGLQNKGLTNGAVLVVDNKTMEVLAYCASADFQNKTAQGEVDAIQALRSPGSTLKPLIFAQAFDEGILHPHAMILDVPTDYSGFKPVNYDLRYRGRVRVNHALQQSLNIPAVRTLDKIGLDNFIQTLRRAGFRGISKQASGLGLSLALGGCGVRLEELVTLYAAFAHGGHLQPLRYLQSAEAGTSQQSICSPEAAWMISDILSGLERPDLPQHYAEKADLPQIAWKTGTSFGRRDAWAIGYNPRFTIGVWMGNMDGSQVIQMSGASASVPLLFDLFHEISTLPSLGKDFEPSWFSRPVTVVPKQYCSTTGHLVGPHCDQDLPGWAILHQTQPKRCEHTQEIFTNADRSIQFCAACAPTGGFQRECYPAYPADLLNWFEAEGMDYQKPPPHNPACQGVFSGLGPKIQSPEADGVYYLETGQELLLKAQSDQASLLHYWYMDGKYIGSAEDGSPFFVDPPRGKITFICMDDKGRTKEQLVEIRDL